MDSWLGLYIPYVCKQGLVRHIWEEWRWSPHGELCCLQGCWHWHDEIEDEWRYHSYFRQHTACPNSKKEPHFFGHSMRMTTHSSSGSKLKICKGLKVIMRGEMLPNNLYKLLRDTIFGGAAVSISENSENDLALYGIFVLIIWVSGLWRSCIRENYWRNGILQDELLQVLRT